MAIQRLILIILIIPIILVCIGSIRMHYELSDKIERTQGMLFELEKAVIEVHHRVENLERKGD